MRHGTLMPILLILMLFFCSISNGEDAKPEVTKRYMCGGIDAGMVKRGSVVFKPNGKGLGFVRLRFENDKMTEMCACIDGIDHPNYKIIEGTIVFSPSGERAAYAARRDRNVLVVDGIEYPSNGSIGDIVFSPDSSRVASIFRHSRTSQSVFEESSGGDSGELFERIDSLGYSADSAHYAYFGYREDEWKFVYDGKVIENKGIMATGGGYVLAGKSFALKGVAKSSRVVLYNKKVYDKYDSTSLPVLSADGRRIAFTATTTKGEYVLVLDGKEIPMPDCKLSELVFAPDGVRLAYVRTTEAGDAVVIGDEVAAVVYKKCTGLSFSANGEHFAYCAQLADNKQCVVVNSAEGKQYTRIEHGPVFAPKSDKVCYFCNGKSIFVLGDKETNLPKDTQSYIAGPAGKHFIVLVPGGRDTKLSCYIDGTEKREDVQLTRSVGIGFEDEDTINYMVLEEGAFFTVSERFSNEP